MSSLNTLVGAFSTINVGSDATIENELICVDTSNNRIGINTIDPSYSIHIHGTGTISTPKLLISNIRRCTSSDPDLEEGEIYYDIGSNSLQIKLP
jgi:hypothetical protein